MEHATIMCPHCGVSRCRTSHFRFSDFFFLPLLQLPLRCHSCQQRFHVAYRIALRLSHVQQSRSFLVMEAEALSNHKPVAVVSEDLKHDH